MKIILSSFLFVMVFANSHAQLPSKSALNRYSSLWEDSPFTSKPPPPSFAPTVNPLDGYALTGIAPINGGYLITIVNKNDRTKKKVIDSTKSGDIKLISVNRNPGKSFATTVVLQTSSGLQGTVAFERDLIKPNPAAQQVNRPAVTEKQNPPGIPPAIQSGAPQVNSPEAPVRAPRPRVIPNSPASPNQQGSENNGTGNRGADRFRRR